MRGQASVETNVYVNIWINCGEDWVGGVAMRTASPIKASLNPLDGVERSIEVN